jgi:hypothetical protein
MRSADPVCYAIGEPLLAASHGGPANGGAGDGLRHGCRTTADVAGTSSPSRASFDSGLIRYGTPNRRTIRSRRSADL